MQSLISNDAYLLSLLVRVRGLGVHRGVPLLRHALPPRLVARERRVVPVVDERREALSGRVDVYSATGAVQSGS